jgi:hypothetical protein
MERESAGRKKTQPVDEENYEPHEKEKEGRRKERDGRDNRL